MAEVKAKEFHEKLKEWYPSALEKFNNLTEYFLSVVKMENTTDIIYDVVWDGTIFLIIVGIDESIKIEFRGDKKNDYILHVTYNTRRRKLELDHSDDFYWQDFRDLKYRKWDDTEIPIEERRMPVYDAAQWEMHDKNCIPIQYEHATSLKYAEEVALLLGKSNVELMQECMTPEMEKDSEEIRKDFFGDIDLDDLVEKD